MFPFYRTTLPHSVTIGLARRRYFNVKYQAMRDLRRAAKSAHWSSIGARINSAPSTRPAGCYSNSRATSSRLARYWQASSSGSISITANSTMPI